MNNLVESLLIENKKLTKTESKKKVSESKKVVKEGVTWSLKDDRSVSTGNIPYTHMTDFVEGNNLTNRFNIAADAMNGRFKLGPREFESLKSFCRKAIRKPEILADPDDIYIVKRLWDVIKNADYFSEIVVW